MILDAATLEPADAVELFVRESDELDLPGKLKTELHASVVELSTGICADVAGGDRVRARAPRGGRAHRRGERARDRGGRHAPDGDVSSRCRSCRRSATSRW